MSRTVRVDVGGVPVTIDIPESATVVRAVVILATERMDANNVVGGSFWGSSPMDGDHLVGMTTRAQRAIIQDLERNAL